MISRRLIAAAALLCVFVAPCHAQKSKTALTAEVNANWPDNTSSAITPAILRSTVIDIIDSYYDLNGGTSLSCAAHQWVAALPTLSSITCTQPTFSDISGSTTLGQLPPGAANSIWINPTNSSAVMQNIAVPACANDGLHALVYIDGTGLECETFSGVTGPGSSTSGDIATYSGTSGTVIQDQPFNTVINTICGSVPTLCSYVFGYVNVRWFGAKGDGVTNDNPPFTAAYNASVSAGDTTILVPNGHYCLFTSVAATAEVHWQGSGINATYLDTCNHDVNLLAIDAPYSSIKGMTFCGQGAECLGAETFGATHANISLTANCGFCVVENVISNGGYRSLEALGNGFCIVQNYSFSTTYGDSFAYFQNAPACRLINGATDQALPYGLPAAASVTIASWAATHAYSASISNIVSTGGYLLQLSGTACTSGSSAPTLANFGHVITDGSCSWKLIGAATKNCILIDSGSSEMELTNDDTGCGGNAAIAIHDDFSNAPSFVSMSGISAGGGFQSIIDVSAGNNHKLITSHLGYCLSPACPTMYVKGTYGGGMQITENSFYQGGPYGLMLLAGVDTRIDDNHFANQTSCGLDVGAGVTDFGVNNNTFANVTCTAKIETGASDYYSVINNNMHGVAVTDGGSGTHKAVTPNY